jgi:hypothetical protein
LNGSCDKDLQGIVESGLYVCFSVFTAKQRLLSVIESLLLPLL